MSCSFTELNSTCSKSCFNEQLRVEESLITLGKSNHLRETLKKACHNVRFSSDHVVSTGKKKE